MSGEDANHFGESIREGLRLFFSGDYGCAQKYFGSLLGSVRDPRWGVLLSLLLAGSMTVQLVAGSNISYLFLITRIIDLYSGVESCIEDMLKGLDKESMYG